MENLNGEKDNKGGKWRSWMEERIRKNEGMDQEGENGEL